MKLSHLALLCMGISAALPLACSDSESSSKPAPWSEPGAGGSVMEAGVGGADSSSAGTAGSATGGSAGQVSDASVEASADAPCDSASGEGGCDADLPVHEAGNDAGFWNGTKYGGQCPPNPADGYHSPGEDCMFCHSGSIAPSFVFGGTIYKPDHQQGAAGVEIGVRSPTGFYLACSGSNGNFWVWGPPDLDWTSAEIRMRNDKGQAIMKSTGAAACNSCHKASPLVAP